MFGLQCIAKIRTACGDYMKNWMLVYRFVKN